jgi:hypothetical protein
MRRKRNSWKSSPWCDSLFFFKVQTIVHVLRRLVFKVTSSLNGESYQMTKPWVPHSYKRCSTRTPSISRQTAVHRMHSPEHASTCWHWSLSQLFEFLPSDLRQTWQGLHKNAYSGVPTWKNPPEFDLTTDEAIQSALNVQSNFPDISRSTTEGYLPHRALQLRHAETTSASQLRAHLQAASVEQFSRKSRYRSTVIPSGSRQRPRKMSPTIPAQTRAPKRISDPRSRLSWGLSRAQRRLLWAMNTPSHAKHASSVHRMLCKKSSFAVCWRSSHSHNCICSGRSSGYRYSLRA